MKPIPKIALSLLVISLLAGTSFAYQVLVNVKKVLRGETPGVTYRSTSDRPSFDLAWYGFYESVAHRRIAGATVQVIESTADAGNSFTTDSRGRALFNAESGDTVQVWKIEYRGLSFTIPSDVPNLDGRVIANVALQPIDLSGRIRSLILRVPRGVPIQ